jgi:tRNA threonylcarbamoyl adenosine modification protein (Sua5/YciO/YrdC/YwlC family)
VQRVAERFDLSRPDEREAGVAVALACLTRGELVVAPTDTVYGLACDAFTPASVAAVLAAKGRGRDMPVPVLVGTPAAYRAITASRGEHGDRLVEAFWPGPLTLVCREQPTLQWDLGDGRGTVAVRMPDHELMLELLRRHGPLAVTSANRTGEPPATTCADAERQLGDAVRVYLDGGPSTGSAASTIIDLTGPTPRVLREGVISVARLREALPDLEAGPAPEPW